jgi:hypothetical protein
MPQPRKYETRAQQQAAYRKRRSLSDQELLAQKGLPPLPGTRLRVIPTMPGIVRWKAMIEQAYTLLSGAVVEMQNYHDDRSEQWQESINAEDLLGRVEHLQETMVQLQGIEWSRCPLT